MDNFKRIVGEREKKEDRAFSHFEEPNRDQKNVT